MVVRAVRGRRRYVAFRLNASLRRADVASRLRFYVEVGTFYVIQCSDGWAIVECKPKEVERIVLLMKRVDHSSVSLLISGTIASLRRKYPNLRKSRVSVGVK